MADLFSPRFNQETPPVPPPAPPLPPRYANRAANAIVRLAQPIFGSSRPPSAQANRNEDIGGRLSAPSSSVKVIGPISSQTATHKTGLPILSCDISSERTHVILGGREILKTVWVSGTNCTEEFNLRSAIIAYASHNRNHESKHRDTLAVNDVKWSHGRFQSVVATAATNGKIVLYDLNRAGVEVLQIHEHDRQVHKLAFNPHNEAYLLSASHDSTLRFWDFRLQSGPQGMMNFSKSEHKYKGNSDGVRDVKWCPSDGVQFACSTDNGTVLKWDFRNNRSPLLKLKAHDKTCQSIDWHPDGQHLASASADKTVKVWNLSGDRKQKPRWFRCPQAVSKVCWRPAGKPLETQSSEKWETSQLVTSYDHTDPRIHLWNMKRPHVPFREIDRYASAPTEMLWHSEDLLWTVGHEGIFTQTDVHFAPKVLERRSYQAFDSGPERNILMLTQLQPPKRLVSSIYESSGTVPIQGHSRGKSNSGEKFGVSRSMTDDEAQDAFLSSSWKKRHGRSFSIKSTAKSINSTPPSAGQTVAIANFEDIMASKKKAYHGAAQIGGVLKVSSAQYDHVFEELALKYKTTFFSGKLNQDFDLFLPRIEDIIARNAGLAQEYNQFRLGQTWRMIGKALYDEVEQRGEKNRKRREETARKAAKEIEAHRRQAREHEEMERIEKLKSAAHLKPRNDPAHRAISEAHGWDAEAFLESTSNMTTPLAKPLPDSPLQEVFPAPMLDDPGNESATSQEAKIGSRLRKSALSGLANSTLTRELSKADLSGNSTPIANRSAVQDGLVLDQQIRSHKRSHSSKENLTKEGDDEWRRLAAPHRSKDRDALLSRSHLRTSSYHRMSDLVGSGRSQSPAVLESSAEANRAVTPLQIPGSTLQRSKFGITPPSDGSEKPLRLTRLDSEDSFLMFSASTDSRPSLSTSKSDSWKFKESEPDSLRWLKPSSVNSTPAIPEEWENDGVMRGSLSKLRASSSDSQPSFPSQTTQSENSSSYSNHDRMENSGTIVPEDRYGEVFTALPANNIPARKVRRQNIMSRASLKGISQGRLPYVKDDFLPPEPTTEPREALEKSLKNSAPIWNITDMFSELIKYFSELGDAQTPSTMLLLFFQFLPQHAIPSGTINIYQCEALLCKYKSQLLSLKLWEPAGMVRRGAHPAFPSVTNYDEDIHTSRKGAHATQWQFGCRKCHSVLEGSGTKLICRNCEKIQAPCPVCNTHIAPPIRPVKIRRRMPSSTTNKAAYFPRRTLSEPDDGSTSSVALSRTQSYPPPVPTELTVACSSPPPAFNPFPIVRSRRHSTNNPTPNLHSFCQTCSHSGHASCLFTWYAAIELSGGNCPVKGCLHPCNSPSFVSGQAGPSSTNTSTFWQQKIRAGSLSTGGGRGSISYGDRDKVVTDKWSVSESQAVQGVRARVGSSATTLGSGGGSVGKRSKIAASLGTGNRTRTNESPVDEDDEAVIIEEEGDELVPPGMRKSFP